MVIYPGPTNGPLTLTPKLEVPCHTVQYKALENHVLEAYCTPFHMVEGTIALQKYAFQLWDVMIFMIYFHYFPCMAKPQLLTSELSQYAQRIDHLWPPKRYLQGFAHDFRAPMIQTGAKGCVHVLGILSSECGCHQTWPFPGKSPRNRDFNGNIVYRWVHIYVPWHFNITTPLDWRYVTRYDYLI